MKDKVRTQIYHVMQCTTNLDDDHTICYHSKLIQSKEFSHKLPLFDDGKFLARCVILPLSLCISAFSPPLSTSKRGRTIVIKQKVKQGMAKMDNRLSITKKEAAS